MIHSFLITSTSLTLKWHLYACRDMCEQKTAEEDLHQCSVPQTVSPSVRQRAHPQSAFIIDHRIIRGCSPTVWVEGGLVFIEYAIVCIMHSRWGTRCWYKVQILHEGSAVIAVELRQWYQGQWSKLSTQNQERNKILWLGSVYIDPIGCGYWEYDIQSAWGMATDFFNIFFYQWKFYVEHSQQCLVSTFYKGLYIIMTTDIWAICQHCISIGHLPTPL